MNDITFPSIGVIIAGTILYIVFIFVIRALAMHYLDIDEDEISNGPMA